MNWILITVTFFLVSPQYSDGSFVVYSGAPNAVISGYSKIENRTEYKVYKNKDDLAKEIKSCSDDKKCNVVGLLGCNSKDCKDYNYILKTEPEIKDSIEMKEK